MMNTRPLILTFAQFMALLTADEQAALVQSNDADTKIFLFHLVAEGVVRPADQRVVQGLNGLAKQPKLDQVKKKIDDAVTAHNTAAAALVIATAEQASSN